MTSPVSPSTVSPGCKLPTTFAPRGLSTRITSSSTVHRRYLQHSNGHAPRSTYTQGGAEFDDCSSAGAGTTNAKLTAAAAKHSTSLKVPPSFLVPLNGGSVFTCSGICGDTLGEQFQARGCECVHVGDAVRAPGLDRDRALDRARHRKAAMPRGIAVAISGGAAGADLGDAPRHREAFARGARQDQGALRNDRLDPGERGIRRASSSLRRATSVYTTPPPTK